MANPSQSQAILQLSQAQQQQLIAVNAWNPQAPVPLERLRMVRVPYWDFSGKQQEDGEIIVLDAVAERVLETFEAMCQLRFPIEQVKPIYAFAGDDEISMAANNSHAFQARQVTGGGAPSIHSYGLAIDINPLYNPYYHKEHEELLPKEGKLYMDRSLNHPAMISDQVVALFKQAGFTVWGGEWNVPKDYHHFQTTRAIAEQLAAMPYEEARAWFLAGGVG